LIAPKHYDLHYSKTDNSATLYVWFPVFSGHSSHPLAMKVLASVFLAALIAGPAAAQYLTLIPSDAS
jgi:hypothetical protein